MIKRTVSGICHICGTHGKLTFEHVPPEAAFNNRKVLHAEFAKVVENNDPDKLHGRVQQRGAGAFTLCAQCNNDTGSWYGAAYAEWAHQAMAIVIGTNGHPSLEYPFNLFPLRVLKQILCMFFSVNGPSFQVRHPDLVRFVLNRESREFPRYLHIYAFYTFSDRSRAVGSAGLVKGIGSGSSSVHVFSEVTFPPFGFVMT